MIYHKRSIYAVGARAGCYIIDTSGQRRRGFKIAIDRTCHERVLCPLQLHEYSKRNRLVEPIKFEFMTSSLLRVSIFANGSVTMGRVQKATYFASAEIITLADGPKKKNGAFSVLKNLQRAKNVPTHPLALQKQRSFPRSLRFLFTCTHE